PMIALWAPTPWSGFWKATGERVRTPCTLAGRAPACRLSPVIATSLPPDSCQSSGSKPTQPQHGMRRRQGAGVSLADVKAGNVLPGDVARAQVGGAAGNTWKPVTTARQGGVRGVRRRSFPTPTHTCTCARTFVSASALSHGIVNKAVNGVD